MPEATRNGIGSTTSRARATAAARAAEDHRRRDESSGRRRSDWRSALVVNAASSEPEVAQREGEPDHRRRQLAARARRTTSKIEKAMLQKKFDVAVHTTCARKFGIAQHEAEAFLRASATMLGSAHRRPTARQLLPCGSRRGRRRDEEAEASRAASPYGAVRARRRSTPAEPGPVSCATERLISSFELPSTSSFAVDERREVRLIGDVEEDGADADEEADHVQLRQRQGVERVGERDASDE